MSNIQLIIEERAANIGNFLVGRLLPFRQKRMIGPFIYIDHKGPVLLNERDHFDIHPHPHIGLSTLTYLFEGCIMHRDSLGNSIEIKPGSVNWMTAGKGIVHSERTPDHLRNTEVLMHGLQIWVALPQELEEMNPEFHHIEQDKLPQWQENGAQLKLIAGEIEGRKSGVPVHSAMYLLEIRTKDETLIEIGERLFGESGLYVLKGQVEIEDQLFNEKQIIVARNSKLCSFTLKENSTIYIFGGEPFPEERFIDWNFVSTKKEKIEEAKENWRKRKFPVIDTDSIEFVPYPERKK